MIRRRLQRGLGYAPGTGVSLCLMGGFSLIEACAAASAVVSYDVEWHRELIHDDETGVLLPEHDVDRLVTAVSALLDEPERRARLGAAARNLALSRHDVQQTMAIKQRCYAELLGLDPAAVGVRPDRQWTHGC